MLDLNNYRRGAGPLSAYLSPQEEWSLDQHEVPAADGVCGKATIGIARLEGRYVRFTGHGKESRKLTKCVLCKDGTETVRLDPGEQREKRSPIPIKILIELKCRNIQFNDIVRAVYLFQYLSWHPVDKQLSFTIPWILFVIFSLEVILTERHILEFPSYQELSIQHQRDGATLSVVHRLPRQHLRCFLSMT